MDRIEALVAQAQQRAAELVDNLTHHGEPDGCELDFTVDPTADEDVDGLVLFAGVDPEDADAVDDLAEKWRRIAADQEADSAP